MLEVIEGLQGIERPRFEHVFRDPELAKIAVIARINGVEMALGVKPYANGWLNAFAKKIDWVNDALKVALLTSSYSPLQTHKWLSDVNGNEVANGNGYVTNGVALGSPTSVVSGSVHTLDAADVSWTSSGAGFSAAYGVIYDSTPGTAGTDPLIAYVDLGGTQTVAGGALLNIVWSASGICGGTVS